MKNKPNGEITVQTIAMPADTNPNGDIFGGWLVSQMDLAGGVMACRRAKQRVVTVAIDSMVFHRPVKVGNLVSCYAEVTKVGTTSMTINIQVWTIDKETGEKSQVTTGVFTYVATDKKGRPTPVDKPAKRGLGKILQR